MLWKMLSDVFHVCVILAYTQLTGVAFLIPTVPIQFLLIGPCVDLHSSCHIYLPLICTQNATWVFRECPYFCGFCNTDVTPAFPKPPAIAATPIIQIPNTTSRTPSMTSFTTTSKRQTTPSFTPSTTTTIRQKTPFMTSSATTSKRQTTPSMTSSTTTAIRQKTPSMTSSATTSKRQTTPSITSSTFVNSKTQYSCVDRDPNCSMYNLKICSLVPYWSRNHCRKSCSFCQDSSSVQTTKSYHWVSVPASVPSRKNVSFHWVTVPDG